MTRLGSASRRGRLPGFHPHAGAHEFHIRIFGQPFDRRLIGSLRPTPGGSAASFRLVTVKWLPWLFVVIAVFTVWPGVWLTESMLESYYTPSRDWWWIGWWYIPLTALPLPWAAKSMWRKSQHVAHAETVQTMEKLEAALLAGPRNGGSGSHAKGAPGASAQAPAVTPATG